MRERAMLIGAQIAIGAAPGGGTEVKLTIPLDAQAP
jgi:two-component system, NarL family, sensor histidine kinase UhpB